MMPSNTVTLITAIVGAVCGVGGLVLGVINTWRQLQRNKLRLKVTPVRAKPVGAIQDARLNFGIEVINMSEFPVTISDVGFLLIDSRKATLAPVPGMEQDRLPQRLEPRTSYSKNVWLDNSVLDLAKVKCAYAHTECGNNVRGTSPALIQLIKQARNHEQ